MENKVWNGNKNVFNNNYLKFKRTESSNEKRVAG